QEGEYAVDVSACVVGLQRRRPEHIGGNERARLAADAYFLVVAEDALSPGDGGGAGLTARTVERLHHRAGVRVEEVFAIAVGLEDRGAIGQAVSARIVGKYHEFGSAPWTERDAALPFQRRSYLVNGELGLDVEIDALVDRAED